MGEWLKPADCKSAPPSEVRRFESFPVHQVSVVNAGFGFVRFRGRWDFEALGDGDGRAGGSRSVDLDHHR